MNSRYTGASGATSSHERAHLALQRLGARRLHDVRRRSHAPRPRRRSGEWEIHDRLAGFPPIVLLHVPHDADDRERERVLIAEARTDAAARADSGWARASRPPTD